MTPQIKNIIKTLLHFGVSTCFIWVSLGINFGLVLLFQNELKFIFNPAFPLPKKENLVYLDEKNSEEFTIVQTEKSPEDFKDGKKARWGGEFKNRVKEETRAPLYGNYRKGDSRENIVEDPGSDLSLSDLLSIAKQPYKLDESIALGGATILNTERVIYASFGNRVTEAIYGLWVSYLHEFIDGMERGSEEHLPENLYVTRLQVLFDKEGGVTAVKTLRSSGIEEVDEAARRVFWDREPFENPPRQLAGEDELIRFNYEFQLDWKASFFRILPRRV